MLFSIGISGRGLWTVDYYFLSRIIQESTVDLYSMAVDRRLWTTIQNSTGSTFVFLMYAVSPSHRTFSHTSWGPRISTRCPSSMIS